MQKADINPETLMEGLWTQCLTELETRIKEEEKVDSLEKWGIVLNSLIEKMKKDSTTYPPFIKRNLQKAFEKHSAEMAIHLSSQIQGMNALAKAALAKIQPEK